MSTPLHTSAVHQPAPTGTEQGLLSTIGHPVPRSGGPLLLDLFCGAGGAAMGYHRAGFRVVGVDHKPQPRYPFEFIHFDALQYLHLLRCGSVINNYSAIHASPPCQRYSHASFCRSNKDRHPDLVDQVRRALEDLALPWVIENVVPAPLSPWSVTLCGLMFGLKVFRHRRFESSHMMLAPSHPSHRGKVIGKDGMCCVVGHGGGCSRRMRDQMARLNRHGSGGQQNKAEWVEAMGIDWMTRNQMSQAIPPAYTVYIGRQLLNVLEGRS